MDAQHFDKSMFEFVQVDKHISDEKLDTKPVSFWRDCVRRFAKNKASVVAFVIIVILLLFSFVGPFLTDYGTSTVADASEGYYKSMLPRTKTFAFLGWDGTKKDTAVNQAKYDWMNAIGTEAGEERAAIVKVYKSYKSAEGETLYDIKYSSYFKVGCIFISVSKADYEALQEYQNRTGKQIMYPIPLTYKTEFNAIQSANVWYKLVDESERTTGLAQRDENGNYIPNYYTRTTSNADKYNSLRIEGDTPVYDEAGQRVYYQYGVKNQTGYKIRVNYYDYYVYRYGREPYFWFGTDQFGYDVFSCLAIGGRISFILAMAVSLINLVIGFVYGAIEGYYGGTADLIMERISDILSSVPFIVVATLFQMHLSGKVGPLPSLLFAFISTGWIGIASRVRSQFYRFKNQEYVLAARTLGASDSRLIWSHIFPNSMGTIITSCVLIIPGVIFSESILSYLNIVDFNTANNMTSIGTMLSNGQSQISTFPHVLVFPAVFISLLEISFNLFGNGLRDAFNPLLRGAEG